MARPVDIKKYQADASVAPGEHPHSVSNGVLRWMGVDICFRGSIARR